MMITFLGGFVAGTGGGLGVASSLPVQPEPETNRALNKTNKAMKLNRLVALFTSLFLFQILLEEVGYGLGDFRPSWRDRSTHWVEPMPAIFDDNQRCRDAASNQSVV